jgi:hypothetical protein
MNNPLLIFLLLLVNLVDKFSLTLSPLEKKAKISKVD